MSPLKIVMKRDAVITSVLFLSLLALHLWTLMRFPAPFVDEVWYTSRTWGYIQTGRVFGDLDRGIFDYYEGYWTVLPGLPIFLRSFFLRFSSAPSLLAMRLASLFFGLVFLGALYATAVRLADRRFAVWTVGLVTLSASFLQVAHIARTDIESATFGYLALALYFNNPGSKVWVAFLSGLCLGLAYHCHPHGVVLGPPIVALYLWHERWAIFRSRAFWAFAAGGIAGLLLFGFLHILPNPDTYFKTMALNYASTHIPPLLTGDPAIILQAFSNMRDALLRDYRAMTLLILAAAGVGLAITRRSDMDKTLLVLVIATFLSHTLLVRNKFAFYSLLSSPMIEMMAVLFAMRLFYQPWWGGWRDYMGRLVTGAMVGFHCLAMIAFASLINGYPSYQAAQQGVNQAVREGDRIIGPQTYWLELYDHPYYPWEALVYYHHYDPDSTLAEAMEQFKPDIFVMDVSAQEFIQDIPANSPYADQLHLSQTELEAFLAKQATVVTEFENGVYGPVKVYRITWPE
ncbi:MAG: glycosyltransferase family 39 protein [Ardenticatenales bacterium]|nr:glycosyltransferase family 39 protein [Ardenticatenales bacterium]